MALITFSWSSCSIVTHLNLTILLSGMVLIVSNSNMKNYEVLEKSILVSDKSSDWFLKEKKRNNLQL